MAERSPAFTCMHWLHRNTQVCTGRLSQDLMYVRPLHLRSNTGAGSAPHPEPLQTGL